MSAHAQSTAEADRNVVSDHWEFWTNVNFNQMMAFHPVGDMNVNSVSNFMAVHPVILLKSTHGKLMVNSGYHQSY